MALKTGKKIVRRSWDAIPFPDLVIDRFNVLGRHQTQQMKFADRQGRLIGDIDNPLPGVVPVIADYIKIPGVEVEGPKAQDAGTAPQVEIDDLDIPHHDPAPIEVTPTQEEQAPETLSAVALPALAPGLRRSTRVGSQTNQGYTPSMSGSKLFIYSNTV
jgi:hypothetical protein